MTGTLSGALAARDIPAFPGKVTTDVEAELEAEDRLLLLKRVHLRYHLRVPRGKREAAERAVAVHERGCPVYQSLQRGFAVTWDTDIVEEDV